MGRDDLRDIMRTARDRPCSLRLGGAGALREGEGGDGSRDLFPILRSLGLRTLALRPGLIHNSERSPSPTN